MSNNKYTQMLFNLKQYFSNIHNFDQQMHTIIII